jgi:4-amino-4-deoxy-L-arabinose transferase-like glycosyltransferase
MNETPISEPAHHGASLLPAWRVRLRSGTSSHTSPRTSWRTNRHVWTIAGVGFLVLNEVFSLSNVEGGPALPVGARIGAVLCFLASFIVYMMEPQRAAARDGEAPASSEGAQGAASPGDGSVGSHSAGDGEKKADAGAKTDEAKGPAPSEPPPGGDESAPGATAPVAAPPLFRPGNPLRLVRGGATAVVASFLTVVLMGYEGQLRWGVPLGTLLVAIASWGVMDLLGTFDDPDDRVEKTTTLTSLRAPLGGFVASWLLFCAALGLAQGGVLLPQIAWGIVVTVAFLLGVAATFEVGVALGAWKVEAEGALWKRHGFWVVVAGAVLYLPTMGTSSLWDPWETHYGEVAREMLARNDWISLWWAQDGWFWSKPVLDMWAQAIAMATLGVHYQPDKMLIGNGTQPIMHPEWAVRAPVVLMTILAMYLLYKGVARTYGRRAALLGSIVLATMPDWYLLAHQTMTDMPFVAMMTACLGLVLLGLRAEDEATVRAYEVKVAGRSFRFTGWHLVFGAILLCALPQIFYLFSRNLEFLWHPGARGFRPHWDEFRSGSGGGNCGLPGNEDCRAAQPAFIPHSTGPMPTAFSAMVWRTVGAFEPVIQALLWSALLAIALVMSWGERRAKRLYYIAAWFFAAISTLGKGPAGFGLPVLVALLYLVASRPSEPFVARLTRIVRELTKFEIVAGLFLILPAVALPWYVAMYVRHGSPFTDRLIFHDMFNRAFHHVHDTNEGDDTSFRFYVWQLGYALFPWTGLAPLGLLAWLRRDSPSVVDTEEREARGDVSVLLSMWFVVGFALFSFMGTKFHHYIFPAVPPVAMLIGVLLDDVLGRARLSRSQNFALYLAGLGVGAALMVYGVARMLPGSFFGFKSPESPLTPGSPVLGVFLLLVGAALTVFTVVLLGVKDDALDDAADAAPDGDATHGNSTHGARMLAAAAVAGALLLVVVGRDLVVKSADQPGAIRLLHLYTYNYRRPWPESLDFSAALAGFTAVAVAVSLALAVRAVRRHAVAAMCALSFVWALWGLDVYMQETAQHWGQHEIIAAYYADRSSPAEQIVAYQMNWKGENFYTGNHVPAFVSTGATFTQWLKKQRESGAKVMYFITEHGRIGGLKSEVSAKSYREVTDKVLCNKFVLVRAEL